MLLALMHHLSALDRWCEKNKDMLLMVFLAAIGVALVVNWMLWQLPLDPLSLLFH
jgi:predicted negative regulator of RcsB-dependent stress response